MNNMIEDSQGYFKITIKYILARLGSLLNEGNRYQKDLYYGQLFNQVTLNSEWLCDKSFAPGRMAVDYCYLYTMYHALNVVRPTNILDVGLGQTSRMFSQYAKWKNSNGGAKVNHIIVEHDPDWIDFFMKQYECDYDIHQLPLLINVPFQISDKIIVKEANIYDGFDKWLLTKGKFDFVSIDGPFGNKKYSRPQMMELLYQDRLKDDFVIMVDDVNRKGEQNTIRLFLDELNKRKNGNYSVNIYNGSKKHCIITTEKYKFLTTL